ncbi:MAG: sugar transferase [Saprospiraceae bacterium]|nr:sugar transferase [Saprospiraceae bacterium]
MNYHLIKRLFDYVSSAIGLILLTPLFIPIILILKFTSEGEIIYLQKRIGQENNEFKILKFATMLKNSPNMSYGTITIPNDPRVTRFGAFFREKQKSMNYHKSLMY